MQHAMKLLDSPYERIASGKKTIEIRLFDEKRQQLHVGDVIEFSKLPELQQKIKVKVIALLRYNTFKELVQDFGMEYYGHPEDYPVEQFLTNLYKIYAPQQEQQYGVVGIKIKLLT